MGLNNDSNLGPKEVVTRDIVISKFRKGKRGIIGDRDMRQCHLTCKLTCDVRTPRQGPFYPLG